ncbi:hypothetical protein [Rhizobium leguminosarum]|nr:hypothetical protein [Rhizobium leguminosarum]NEK34310.1 hypothetical protein [Rhizobium leguminosarum]
MTVIISDCLGVGPKVLRLGKFRNVWKHSTGALNHQPRQRILVLYAMLERLDNQAG